MNLQLIQERLLELEKKFEQLANAELDGERAVEGQEEHAFAGVMNNPEPYYDPVGVGRKQSSEEPAFARMMNNPENPEPYYEPAVMGRKQSLQEPYYGRTMNNPGNPEPYYEPAVMGTKQSSQELTFARMMKYRPALSQQNCDTTPVCAPPSTLDSNGCRCETKTDEVKVITCPTMFLQTVSNGQCICVTVLQMQCDAGFRFSQSNNCQCVSETDDDEKRDATCPSGSFRPGGTCYCVLTVDPSCPSGGGYALKDDKCSCTSVEYSSPTCSNPTACSLEEQSCMCK